MHKLPNSALTNSKYGSRQLFAVSFENANCKQRNSRETIETYTINFVIEVKKGWISTNHEFRMHLYKN